VDNDLESCSKEWGEKDFHKTKIPLVEEQVGLDGIFGKGGRRLSTWNWPKTGGT